MDLEVKKNLCQTLEALTHSGNPSLDHDLMKKVKQICKSSEVYVSAAYEALLRDLAKDHSEVRLSTFQVIDQLFQRSHQFRQLVSVDFQKVLTLVSGVSLLPPPKSAADKLKRLSLLTIKEWVEKFGEGYPKLKLGYNYLKFNKKVDFEQLVAATEVEQRQREERESRQRAFMQQRLEKIKIEMREQLHDIQTCFKEMESCFQILMPNLVESLDNGIGLRTGVGLSTETKCNDSDNDSDSETEWEEIQTTENPLNVNGVVGSTFNVTVTVPDKVKISREDNETLVETLKEHHKLLSKTYLPRINKWIEWFTKAGDESNLKEAIDLKAEAIAIRSKYSDLQIINSEGEEEIEPDLPPDDIPIFINSDTPSTSGSNIQGSVPWTTIHYRSHPSSSVIEEELALDPTTPQAQMKARGLLNKVTTSTGSSSDTSVPLLPFDTDLINWGKPTVPDLTPTAMDSLHRYWCQEPDISVSEDLQSLSKCRTITFAGEFEPIKWTCRAPLPSGQLCPRKDRHKCPLHGPIVARDEQGQPVMETSSNGPLPAQLPSKESKKVRKGHPKKHPGLTDITEAKKTAKGRIEAKIMNKRTLSKVGKSLDSLNQKKAKAKFADNFNYSLRS